MARSLNGGAPSKPKPRPVPLRYRIDPTAKKLDDLDDLELELRRNERDYEPDDYEAMLDKIYHQRSKIVRLRDKHLPPEIPDPPPKPIGEVIWDSVTLPRLKWALFLFVLIGLYFRNSS